MVISYHGLAARDDYIYVKEGSDEPYTAHTTNNVPLILVDDERSATELRPNGGLADVAPTVLKIMGIEVPPEMEGEPLF